MRRPSKHRPRLRCSRLNSRHVWKGPLAFVVLTIGALSHERTGLRAAARQAGEIGQLKTVKNAKKRAWFESPF